MELIPALVEAYAKQFSSELEPLLKENEEYTLAHHPHAIMHSGHLQGKLLEMISHMIRPSKVLEIGTFTGFSALCLAQGIVTGGMLHSIELRAEDAATAAAYFKKSTLAEKLTLHTGDAKEIIPTLQEMWDIVFIDADKVSYIDYYELTLPFVRKGGWILADNVLFHGQVLEPMISGKNAKAIQAFNEHVAADNRVEQVMLTVRDGLLLIRKL
jgi:predicted O-methyltransferase YrrM